MASLRLLRQLFLITATITILTCLVDIWGVNHPIAKSLAFVIAAAAILGFFEFWKHDLSLLGTYSLILMVLFTLELIFCIVAIINIPEARENKRYFWTCWLLIPLVGLLMVQLILSKRAYLTHSIPTEETDEFLFSGKQPSGRSPHTTDYGSAERNVFRGHWNYQDRPLANDPHQFFPPTTTGSSSSSTRSTKGQKEKPAPLEEDQSITIEPYPKIEQERPNTRSGDDWSHPEPSLSPARGK